MTTIALDFCRGCGMLKAFHAERCDNCHHEFIDRTSVFRGSFLPEEAEQLYTLIVGGGDDEG